MPFGGKITDTKGWYNTLITGICINFAGLFLTAFSFDIISLIVFRSLTAVGFGLVFISCQKFITDNTDNTTRSAGMATFLAAFFSGDICGTVIGAMLAERIGYSNVFIISSCFSAVTLIIVYMIFNKEQAVNKKEKVASDFRLRDIFKIFKDKEFFSILFFQAIPAKIALVGFLFYFTPLYLQKIGALQSDIGRIIMCYSVAIIFAGPLFAKFSTNQSARRIHVLTGGLLTGAAFISFEFFNSFQAVIIIVLLLGTAQSLSVSSQASYISETKIVKELGLGTGMGIFRFWERIGNISGPVIISIFIAFSGYEKAVVYTGFISIATSIIFLIFNFINLKQKD
jgi:predicted MFS family arabinose efflux permease